MLSPGDIAASAKTESVVFPTSLMDSFPTYIPPSLSASSDWFGSPLPQLPAGFRDIGNHTVPASLWAPAHFDYFGDRHDRFRCGNFYRPSRKKTMAAFGDRLGDAYGDLFSCAKEDFLNNRKTSPFAVRNSCSKFNYAWDHDRQNSFSTAAQLGLPQKPYPQYTTPLSRINTLPDLNMEAFGENEYYSPYNLDKPDGSGHLEDFKSSFMPAIYKFNHGDDNASTKPYELFSGEDDPFTYYPQQNWFETWNQRQDISETEAEGEHLSRKYEELYKEMKEKYEELHMQMQNMFIAFNTFRPEMELKVEGLVLQLQDVKDELCALKKNTAPDSLSKGIQITENEENLQTSDMLQEAKSSTSNSEWEFI